MDEVMIKKQNVLCKMLSARRLTRPRRITSSALLLATIVSLIYTCDVYGGSGPIISVETALGAKVTVPYEMLISDRAQVAGPLLNKHIMTYRTNFGRSYSDEVGIVLQLAEGMYIGLPIDQVRSGELHEGITTLTLADGKLLKGVVCSTLISDDYPEAQYKLSTVRKFNVTIPEGDISCPRSINDENLWHLNVNKPREAIFKGKNFRFVWLTTFTHMKRGLIEIDKRRPSIEAWGGGKSHSVQQSVKFWITLGGKKFQGNLADYYSIKFKEKQMTVEFDDGSDVTGPFTVMADGSQWAITALVMNLREIPGGIIALDFPLNCTLTRVPSELGVDIGTKRDARDNRTTQ